MPFETQPKDASKDDELVLKINPRIAAIILLVGITIFSWRETIALAKLTKEKTGGVFTSNKIIP